MKSKKPPIKKPIAGNQKQRITPSKVEAKKPFNPLYYSLIITTIFFVVALFGLMHHQMWRDELQAWLVARDAHSIPQLFHNMKFEGNPALWHLLLFIITCFTHNPVYMQALHLVIACGFIFVFNRYSDIEMPYKIMFTFSYFTLFEYSVISRSYGLGVLLIFIACALFKNRSSHYILLGIILALLANVTIYGVAVALGIAGVLGIDYFFHQTHNSKNLKHLLVGLLIIIIGIAFSIYQIMPDKNSTFPAFYAKEVFEFPRWASVFSRLFATYFYIPNTDVANFWNTNYYYIDGPVVTVPYWAWFTAHPVYLWTWVYLPVITLLLSLIIFLRKPMILLLYAGITAALLVIFYYTELLFYRYCGYLLITLIACYWLAKYYPDKKFNNRLLAFLANLGKKIQTPFLILILATNIIGAMVAYSKTTNNQFTPSKDAANFIHENKLDTLTIAGTTDFLISPLAAYLNTKIFYLQLNDFGSYCEWSNRRKNDFSLKESVASVDSLIHNGRTKLVWVKSSIPQITNDGKKYTNLEHGLIADDIKLDLLKSFNPGIETSEMYYIYLVQKVDPKTDDLKGYTRLSF